MHAPSFSSAVTTNVTTEAAAAAAALATERWIVEKKNLKTTNDDGIF